MSTVRLAAAVLAVCLALPAAAQGIPKAQSPEEVGFLSGRLQRLSDRIDGPNAAVGFQPRQPGSIVAGHSQPRAITLLV